MAFAVRSLTLGAAAGLGTYLYHRAGEKGYLGDRVRYIGRCDSVRFDDRYDMYQCKSAIVEASTYTFLATGFNSMLMKTLPATRNYHAPVGLAAGLVAFLAFNRHLGKTDQHRNVEFGREYSRSLE